MQIYEFWYLLNFRCGINIYFHVQHSHQFKRMIALYLWMKNLILNSMKKKSYEMKVILLSFRFSCGSESLCKRRFSIVWRAKVIMHSNRKSVQCINLHFHISPGSWRSNIVSATVWASLVWLVGAQPCGQRFAPPGPWEQDLFYSTWKSKTQNCVSKKLSYNMCLKHWIWAYGVLNVCSGLDSNDNNRIYSMIIKCIHVSYSIGF